MDNRQSLRIYYGNKTKNVVAGGYRNADHYVGINDATPFSFRKLDLLSRSEKIRQDRMNLVYDESDPRASPFGCRRIVRGVPDAML